MSGDMNVLHIAKWICLDNSKAGVIVNYFIKSMQITDLKQHLPSQKK